MCTRLLVLTLLLASSPVALYAQHVPAAPGGFGVTAETGSASSTITRADISYAGGGRVEPSFFYPWCGGGQTYYGDGFTTVRRASDTTSPLHFMSLAFDSLGYDPLTCPGGNKWTVYERRMPAMTVPPNPLDWGSWSITTPAGGQIYQGPATTSDQRYGGKKVFHYPEQSSVVASQGGLDNTGKNSIFQDAVSGHTWLGYQFGYPLGAGNVATDWSFVVADLDYATGGSTASGPWKFIGIGPRASHGWLARLPQAWADRYTPGKPLIAGGGNITSVVAQGDVSVGVSAIAFAEMAGGAAERTDIPGVPLVGFYPTVSTPGPGVGRMDRPTSVTFGAHNFYSDIAWGPRKQTQFDYVNGCAVPDTSTGKTGLVCIVTRGGDVCGYVIGNLFCERFWHSLVIYPLASLSPVSGLARYDIQPAEDFEIRWPNVDYTEAPYGLKTLAQVSTIDGTGMAGSHWSFQTSPSWDCTHLPTITTMAPHGIGAGQTVSIRGTSQDGEYGSIWVVCDAPTATTLRVGNTSDPTGTWAGLSAIGGAIYHAAGVNAFVQGPRGISWDAATSSLYVGLALFQYLPSGGALRGQPGTFFIHALAVTP